MFYICSNLLALNKIQIPANFNHIKFAHHLGVLPPKGPHCWSEENLWSQRWEPLPDTLHYISFGTLENEIAHVPQYYVLNLWIQNHKSKSKIVVRCHSQEECLWWWTGVLHRDQRSGSPTRGTHPGRDPQVAEKGHTFVGAVSINVYYFAVLLGL